MALVDDYIAAVQATGPAAFWPMQEASGSLADVTGNGHTAVPARPAGNTYDVDGPCAQMRAIEFNGFGGFLVGDDDVWSSSSLSIEAIVHRSESQRMTGHDYLARKQSSGVSSEWSFFGAAYDRWGGRVADPTDTRYADAYGPVGSPCKWVHLAFVYNDATRAVAAYANGASIASGHGGGARAGNGPGDLGIGILPGWAMGNDLGWDGRMTMMAFWDRALSAGEVSAHYAAMPHGCGIDCRHYGWSVGMVRGRRG